MSYLQSFENSAPGQETIRYLQVDIYRSWTLRGSLDRGQLRPMAWSSHGRAR